ncbi:hypothetical protein [Lysobacter sp.]|uniref:hypothetical protein n=1 Tax=Lysobacter sp. TaxID=72226 RepID=UPI002D36759C|nr:hypothetical protein [Lysobacter sp.]HZX77895.1 hypothetical protein [Lysobacter sp.]
MKQFSAAALFVAGLLISGSGIAQNVRCVLVCSPPRVYCVPNGAQLPPIIDICKGYQTSTTLDQSLLSAPAESTAAPSACSAQSVFNEETQTYEWEMACD